MILKRFLNINLLELTIFIDEFSNNFIDFFISDIFNLARNKLSIWSKYCCQLVQPFRCLLDTNQLTGNANSYLNIPKLGL